MVKARRSKGPSEIIWNTICFMKGNLKQVHRKKPHSTFWISLDFHAFSPWNILKAVQKGLWWSTSSPLIRQRIRKTPRVPWIIPVAGIMVPDGSKISDHSDIFAPKWPMLFILDSKIGVFHWNLSISPWIHDDTWVSETWICFFLHIQKHQTCFSNVASTTGASRPCDHGKLGFRHSHGACEEEMLLSLLPFRC